MECDVRQGGSTLKERVLVAGVAADPWGLVLTTTTPPWGPKAAAGVAPLAAPARMARVMDGGELGGGGTKARGVGGSGARGQLRCTTRTAG